MILFSCDYCDFESEDSADVREVNLLQVAAHLNGKREPGDELLKKGENHLCNSCYKTFIAWSGSKLKNWIKDNFPLGKPGEDDNSG